MSPNERREKLRRRLPLLLAVVCFGIASFDALSPNGHDVARYWV